MGTTDFCEIFTVLDIAPFMVGVDEGIEVGVMEGGGRDAEDGTSKIGGCSDELHGQGVVLVEDQGTDERTGQPTRVVKTQQEFHNAIFLSPDSVVPIDSLGGSLLGTCEDIRGEACAGFEEGRVEGRGLDLGGLVHRHVNALDDLSGIQSR